MCLCPAHRSGLHYSRKLTDSKQTVFPLLRELVVGQPGQKLWTKTQVLLRNSEAFLLNVLAAHLMKSSELKMKLLMVGVLLWKCIPSKFRVKKEMVSTGKFINLVTHMQVIKHKLQQQKVYRPQGRWSHLCCVVVSNPIWACLRHSE